MPRVLSTRLLDTITIHGDTGAGFGSGHPIKQVKRDEYLVEINGLVGRIKLVSGDAGVPSVGEGYIEVLPYGVVSGEGATALVSTMVANGVDVVVGGTDYNVGDVVTVVGGTSTTPATIEITEVDGGIVVSATILEPGVYTELPANPVAVTGDGNDDATFNLTYSVSTIDVIDGGNDYDNARVVIDGNATAEVIIDSGEIDEITVISGGSGYTEIPDVTILACQDIEFAKVVLRNIVNTYDGNLYKWKFGVEATETGEATIL